jgi:UDP-N-acetylglucosamine 2-epimerase
MQKILTIFGTRPEIIKLSVLLGKIDKLYKHYTLFTGQNYDEKLSKIFFQDLKIRKPNFLCKIEKKSIFNDLSNIFIFTEKVINKIKPDAIILLGDTNSCLTGIVAKKFKIPIFHLEAGNRCFDQRVPEEINRKIIDHISDVNLVYTEHARRNLISEGLDSQYIIKTGSPMLEIIENFETQIKNSKILEKLKLSKNSYILFSSHREENLDSSINFQKLIEFLKILSKKFNNKKIIVSTHPRLKKKINNKKINYKEFKNIFFNEPFKFTDYITLQKNAFCIFSDSGTLTEESAILGTESVIIRENHERPEGDECATCMTYDFDKKNFGTILNIISQNKKIIKNSKPPIDYGNNNFSEIVIYTINNFLNKINKFKYFKN